MQFKFNQPTKFMPMNENLNTVVSALERPLSSFKISFFATLPKVINFMTILYTFPLEILVYGEMQSHTLQVVVDNHVTVAVILHAALTNVSCEICYITFETF